MPECPTLSYQLVVFGSSQQQLRQTVLRIEIDEQNSPLGRFVDCPKDGRRDRRLPDTTLHVKDRDYRGLPLRSCQRYDDSGAKTGGHPSMRSALRKLKNSNVEENAERKSTGHHWTNIGMTTWR